MGALRALNSIRLVYTWRAKVHQNVQVTRTLCGGDSCCPTYYNVHTHLRRDCRVVESLPERACDRTVLISQQLALVVLTHKQTVACTARGVEHVGQTCAVQKRTCISILQLPSTSAYHYQEQSRPYGKDTTTSTLSTRIFPRAPLKIHAQ